MGLNHDQSLRVRVHRDDREKLQKKRWLNVTAL